MPRKNPATAHLEPQAETAEDATPSPTPERPSPDHVAASLEAAGSHAGAALPIPPSDLVAAAQRAIDQTQQRMAELDQAAADRQAQRTALQQTLQEAQETVRAAQGRLPVAREALAAAEARLMTLRALPDGSVAFGTKASGQLKIQGTGPAGNDSISPVVTVQPQSVGKQVLYNTQDAAALEAGVPEAAEERPSPAGDIVLDPGAFHQGGHQYPAGAPDRQVGVRPAPSVAEGAMTPAPTAIPRTNTTVGNSGSPNTSGYGQVQTAGSLVQRIAILEAKAAAEEAALAAARATVQRIGEPLDVFIARQQEARGKAEIAVLTQGLPAQKK